MVQSAAKFTGYMLNPISHGLVRPHQVRDCNILLRDCEQSESEQIDLRRAPSSTHHNRIYPTSRPHRNEPIPLQLRRQAAEISTTLNVLPDPVQHSQ